MPQFQHRSRSASCWLPLICLRPFPHWCPYRPDPARPRQQPWVQIRRPGDGLADMAPAPATRQRPRVGAHTLAEGQAGRADTSGDATIGLSDEFMMNRQLTRATSRPARSPAAARTRPSCAPRDADRPAPGHRRRGRTPALGPRPGTPGPARRAAGRRSARGSGSTAAVSRSWTRRARASSSTAAMRSMTTRTRARPAARTARSGQSADGRRLTAGG